MSTLRLASTTKVPGQMRSCRSVLLTTFGRVSTSRHSTSNAFGDRWTGSLPSSNCRVSASSV